MIQRIYKFIAECGCKVRAIKLDKTEAWGLAWEYSALTGYHESPVSIFRNIEDGNISIMGVRLMLKPPNVI